VGGSAGDLGAILGNLGQAWAILGRSWMDFGIQDRPRSFKITPGSPACPRNYFDVYIYIYHLLYMQPSPAACPPRGARRPPIAIALSVGLEHEFLFFRQEYYLGKHSSASG